MNKYYDDRFDRGEDFSDPPEVPEECLVCGYCKYFDHKMKPFVFLSRHGDEHEAHYCDGRKNDEPGLMLTEFERDACAWFEPTQEALDIAADDKAYHADPYSYNGVSPKDF